MDPKSGLQETEATIRATCKTPPIPHGHASTVIMISGHANIEMAIDSLKHGAFEFVEKPFDRSRLLNFITRAVENIKLKSENKESGLSETSVSDSVSKLYWRQDDKALAGLDRQGGVTVWRV